MKRLMILLSAALFAAAITGCTPSPDTSPEPDKPDIVQQAPAVQPEAPPPLPPGGGFTGKVVETMDASGYTYVRVDDGQSEIWAAAPQFAVQVGEEVTVPEGMPMADYHSATLDRDFDVVYFVATVIKGGAPAAGDPGLGAGEEQQVLEGMHASVGPAAGEASVSFEGLVPPEGGKTVAQIWEGKDDLAGQEVAVRGKAVKFNAQVMGKNWIHVQDGTGGEGTNDLTVTTSSTAAVGDTVLVRGVLTMDKDFGFGYRYDLIIEDAEVTVE